MTFYPTHENGLLDDRLDRIDAANDAQWADSHPDWRDLALDAWEDEQERLRAEADYPPAWRQ